MCSPKRAIFRLAAPVAAGAPLNLTVIRAVDWVVTIPVAAHNSPAFAAAVMAVAVWVIIKIVVVPLVIQATKCQQVAVLGFSLAGESAASCSHCLNSTGLDTITCFFSA